MSGCGRRFSREKTFADSPKPTKFAKVFSLESFPLYGTLQYYCFSGQQEKALEAGKITGMYCRVIYTNLVDIVLLQSS